MKDPASTARKITHILDATSRYSRKNWKSFIIVLWMVLVTYTLVQQQHSIEAASSYTQVANLRLAVDDVRYSVETMETDVESVERAVTRMDNAVKGMELTINRIHAQVRVQP